MVATENTTIQPSGKPDELILTGVVTEALPNVMFRVQLDTIPALKEYEEMTEPPEIIAYLAGKMRYNRIRVIVGDQVQVLMNQQGGKARLVRRL